MLDLYPIKLPFVYPLLPNPHLKIYLPISFLKSPFYFRGYKQTYCIRPKEKNSTRGKCKEGYPPP